MLAKISGRTGNLRAPTLKSGNTYYVGFNEELYQDELRAYCSENSENENNVKK